MTHLFTNANSNVRVASYIKKGGSSSFEETSGEAYTKLEKDDTIRLDITGFEFRKEQSVSNARLICYFESLMPNDELTIKYANGSTIDEVIVGSDQNYLNKRVCNYVSFDLTEFISDRARIGSMASIFMSFASRRECVNFVGFKYLDNSNADKSPEDKQEYFMVPYANIEGVESHFAFDKKPLGMSGEAMVNIRQGNLICVFPLSLNNPNVEQVGLFLTYNSLRGNADSAFGKGFRGPIEYDFDLSSKSSGILKLTNQTLKKGYYSKLSADERYKLTPETNKDVYYCHSDSTYIVDEGDESFTLVSENKKMNFSQNGQKAMINYFLLEDGLKIKVVYNDGFPKELIYPDGKNDSFVYSGSHLAKVVSSRFGIETSFEYEGGNLSKVTTEKISLDLGNDMREKRDVIRKTDLVYENGDLKRIVNSPERKALAFTYKNGRVASIVEKAIDDDGKLVDGKSDHFVYSNTFTIVTDRQGNQVLYHFDAYGSCTYTLDQNGVSNNFKFGSVSETDQNMECHKLRSKRQSQGNIPNLIYNGGFEFADEPLKGWTINKGSAESASLSKESLYGESCLNVAAAKDREFAFAQSFNQKSGGTFTLDGFYKSNGNEPDSASKVVLLIKYVEEIKPSPSECYYSGESKSKKIDRTKETVIDLPLTNGSWKEFSSEAIGVPTGSDISLTIECGSDISFDEIQLTRNNFVGGYNYLRNSHFENVTNGGPTSWKTTNMNANDGISNSLGLITSNAFGKMVEGNVFKIGGSAENRAKCLEQRINLKGDSGERLVANCWVNGKKTSNERFQLEVDVHYVGLMADRLKKYFFSPSNDEEGWQVITGLVSTERPYDYVIVRVTHRGFNCVFVDAIQLFKSKTGSTFSYDEKGNLMSASDTAKNAESSYDKNSRMTRKSCTDGQQFQYAYDASKGKVTRITDNFGNDVSFDYSENGVVKEIKSGDLTIRTEEKQIDKGPIAKTDDLGNKTESATDEFGNVVSYVDGNGTVTRKSFDLTQRPIEIERSSDGQSFGTAKFTHSPDGSVSSITCSNGSLLTMEYDCFGNMLSAHVNGDCLERSEYANPSDKLASDILVKGNADIHKRISYDGKGKIESIAIDGNETDKLRYDDRGRLIETEDIAHGKTHHFNYDEEGTLTAITDSEGDSVYSDIDNLGNVEKEIAKIGESRVSSNYIHDYEFNEADRTTFFERLGRTYKDDLIVGDHGVDGLYGAKPRTAVFRYAYDEFVRMSTSELAYSGNELKYSLSKVNSARQNDLSSGGGFNKFLWNLNFKRSKTVYGWLRLLGKVEGKTILRFSGKESSVSLVALSSQKLRLVADEATKDIILGNDRITDWNMYSLSVFDQGNGGKACFYLNGNFICMLTLGHKISENLTDLTIGDTALGDGQSGAYHEANETPIRIAMLSIGSYFYKKANFKAIYDISKKFLFDPSDGDSYSGVCFETSDGEDGDFISLNGAFTSSKRLTPLVASYGDGSYKIDKARSFEFDKELKRHVYSSYDGVLKLQDRNESRLAYELGLTNKGTISLKFKPTIKGEDYTERTIVSFSDGEHKEKLSLYLDANDVLNYSVDGKANSLELIAENGSWNALVIKLNGLLALNGVEKALPPFDLTGLTMNVGSSIDGAGAPNKHLNGLICDIRFAKGDIRKPIESSSVLEKRDTFGRRTGKWISFAGKALSKTEYGYVAPKDANGKAIPGRTSVAVAFENGDKTGKISYGYDANRNVTSLTVEKNGSESVTSYRYDPLERLVSSSKKGDAEKNDYVYDDNGNVLRRTLVKDGTTSVTEFQYDEDNKEKLVKVVKDGLETPITYSPDSMYPIAIGEARLNWSMERLSEFVSGDVRLHFDYDYLGRRIKKISEGSEIEYVYGKDKLIAEISGSAKKFLVYDEKGSLAGFVKETDGATSHFFFLKDQLGNIRSVMDSKGSIVAEYDYDDYGLVKNPESVDFEFNDILYKGYVYDRETELYLLGGRYYSPALMRYISPDKIGNLVYGASDLAQFNLFSYCGDNPISRMDGNGENWFTDAFKKIGNALKKAAEAVVGGVIAAAGIVIGAVTGAVVGGANAMITSIKKGESFGEIAFNTIKGVGEGAAVGIAAVISAGIFLSGYMFGDDETMKMGINIFDNTALPMAISFAQENIIGLMSLAGDLHNRFTTLSDGNDPFRAILSYITNGSSCDSDITQADLAEDDYSKNMKTIGENEKNLIFPTMKDEFGYLKPTSSLNIVVDGKVYITNQNDSFYSTIKYGFATIKFSGCEVMAIYNLLRYLGKKVPFAKLIYYFEKRNIAFSCLGALPNHMRDLLDSMGIPYRFTIDKSDIPEFTPSRFDAVVPTYFNHYYVPGTKLTAKKDANFYLMIHTTFMPKITVYTYRYDDPDGEKDSLKFLEVNGSGETNGFQTLEDNGIVQNPTSDKDKVMISLFGFEK